MSLNEEEAKSILVKYIEIDVPNMVINTNWIIDIVTVSFVVRKYVNYGIIIHTYKNRISNEIANFCDGSNL